ncbi:asparagine synthetase B family protein [Sphingomonas sp.]|uniref:asparagine synthetase B family protein n=1 Tax=Sphingomonas sp. TaxID=28214 RepID=UPI003D6CFC39
MSGIAGVILTDGRDVTTALLDRMASASPRRGFDGTTAWHVGPAGLIRHHHATTPEAVGERQPFTGASGATIAFDGRLDNRADLLALLGERGCVLAQSPDCEIALALFEARGERFLTDLVGDWALAIWQPGRRRLFCARSPMGWRPFLWTFGSGCFGFSTEPRALVVGLGLERRLNEAAIGEFIAARFVTHTETFWSGVHRLEQGGALALENGTVRLWHWHAAAFEDLSALSDDDHVDRFNELFDQALIAAMRSVTPVVSHLSGGLDSSSVVARATELHRAGRIDRQVGAVTARFPGEVQDETVWSSAVERHLGITARVTAAEPYSLPDAAKWCADTLQLPVRPNVFDTTTAAFRLLEGEGGRVLLTGEGGDDWMAGGYGHFPDLLRAGRIGALMREGMSQFSDPSAFVRLRRAAFLGLAPLVSPRHRRQFLLPHLRLDSGLPPWIRSDWAARVRLDERWRDSDYPVDPPLYSQKQRYAVFAHARRHIAHDPILAYAEQHGVEMRHPMHDLRLAHFFMGASGRMLRRNGEKKHILREAMRGSLPELVRTRQDKAVFISSIVDVIAERLRERPPEKLLPVQLGWVDGARLAHMFEPAQAWREARSTEPLTRTTLGPIWFVVAMDLWLENAVGM